MTKLHSSISLNWDIVRSNIHLKSKPDGPRKGQCGTSTVTMDKAHKALAEVVELRLQQL